MDIKDFVKLVNQTRLKNKNQWYIIERIVNGKEVQLKGFDTWLQVFNINGVNCPNPMEQSVKDFKDHLKDNLINP